MKHNRIPVLRMPGISGLALSHEPNPGLLALRRIAVGAIIASCLTAAWASDAPAAREPASQATPVQRPVYTPQAYQMERYKAFARQAEMPSIAVTNHTTLEVGAELKTDIARLAELSTSQREALADRCKVPSGVIDKLVQRVSNAAQPDADQFARELRTAVIDYRFLQGEWGQYHPPPEGQKVKADAVAALQTGDIPKAWELYDGLRKPQAPSIAAPAPPTHLRVVSQ